MIIVLIEAPSSLRVKLPNYVTIDKQDITPENKKKVSEELSITDWLDIRSCDSVHTQVETFQLMIKSLFDKHCTAKHVGVPCNKPVVTTPLIRKLRRAKLRAHQKKNPAWKFL